MLKPAVMPDEPDEAAVICPCASTVKSVLVYDPALTPVVSIVNVTVPEVPPPVNPVPAVTPVISPVVGVAHEGTPEASVKT